MVNKKFWLGILGMALVFGMVVIGCGDDGGAGGAGTDPALNGTWVRNIGGGYEHKFNNGNFESSYAGVPEMKGTYTTGGNKMTRQTTHVNGTIDSDLAAKWYTKSETETALKAASWPDQEIAELLLSLFSPEIVTYSVSGNTATLDGTTYTRK